MKAGLTKLEIR